MKKDSVLDISTSPDQASNRAQNALGLKIATVVGVAALILGFTIHVALRPPIATTNVPTGKTWCGKRYEAGSQAISPLGSYPVPPPSDVPLLDFRCSPAIKPYVAPEDDAATLFFDMQVVYRKVQGAQKFHFDLMKVHNYTLTITTDTGEVLSDGVGLWGTASDLGVSLSKLVPRSRPYKLTCSARFPNGEVFHSSTSLHYLPSNPSGGSTVKQDLRRNTLMTRNATTRRWDPIIPFGFYTSFGDYLAKDLTVLDQMKARGYNLVHPVPTFDNLTALEPVLDHMEELGLWLMYDMRWSYQNLTSVKEQVDHIKRRKNLLLWYTADEPDGWGDPLKAPKLAAEFINEADGYHPVSLALNCLDFQFQEYTDSADIILQDTYPFGINASHSVVYDTVCNATHGVCGCDDCTGMAEDISVRLDTYQQRLDWDGRRVALWSVSQAFGEQDFWSRLPTGREFVMQAFLSFNHGARGIVPWLEPTTSEINDAASTLAQSLPILTPFIASSESVFQPIVSNTTRVDIGSWTLNGETLFLVTNLNTFPVVATIRSTVQSDGTHVLGIGGNVKHLVGELHFILEGSGSLGYLTKFAQ